MTDINKQIEEEANSETVTYNWKHELFAYMQDEHDVTMLDSDMHEVFDICKKEFEHSSRWRKVSEELPEDNKDVLVKVNIQGYIHFEVDRIIYGEWMNGDNGIIEWKPID